MRPAAFIAALMLLVRPACAEGTNVPASSPPPDTAKPAAKSSAKSKSQTSAQMQETIDRLAQSNRDLLDLLKQQQSILQDIQYDRRQQSRREQDLEERLTQANQQNAQLQAKVARLEADAVVRPSVAFTPNVATNAAPIAAVPPPAAATAKTPALPKPLDQTAAAEPPATYLPPAPSEPAAGTKGWHRILAFKGAENKQTDAFEIHGHAWRVVWHNLDKPGKLFQNTSALFINAFPKDDTIPQKVSAKLGTGGDSTTLQGPGFFYLKIEASGGSWEAAIEEYR